MKPTARRKLTLKVETLKLLTYGELTHVVGGSAEVKYSPTSCAASKCCEPP